MSKPPGNFPIEGLSSNVFTVNMYYNVMNATDETLGMEFATMIMPDLLSALGDKFAILLDPIECQPYNFTLQVTRDTYDWLWTFAADITPVLLKHDIRVLCVFMLGHLFYDHLQ